MRTFTGNHDGGRCRYLFFFAHIHDELGECLYAVQNPVVSQRQTVAYQFFWGEGPAVSCDFLPLHAQLYWRAMDTSSLGPGGLFGLCGFNFRLERCALFVRPTSSFMEENHRSDHVILVQDLEATPDMGLTVSAPVYQLTGWEPQVMEAFKEEALSMVGQESSLSSLETRMSTLAPAHMGTTSGLRRWRDRTGKFLVRKGSSNRSGLLQIRYAGENM